MYYDYTKILNMKDLNKEEPNIYLISTNRSAGKTFAFLKKFLTDFKEKGSKFILLYRHNYELSSSNMIFEDVLRLNPDLGTEMKTLSHARGLFYELFLDDNSCGFALSMHNPDSLKKYSPIFAECEQILLDEFQSETGKYLSKELQKFQSIYLTVARGGGSQSRNVKCYLLGNMITIMNPYFIYFDIHKRLKADTKFMRGEGWVAEFGFNESASNSIKNNSFFKAFKNDDYMNSSTEKVYMYDSSTFIDRPSGKSKYICTITHDNLKMGVRDFYENGILYISQKIDNSCRYNISFKASDHTQNTVMLNHYSFLWKNVSDAFKNGYLRFDDIKTKNAIYDILGVDMFK